VIFHGLLIFQLFGSKAAKFIENHIVLAKTSQTFSLRDDHELADFFRAGKIETTQIGEN